ncbi:MAG TPA: GcrA family cell cycle regulator [Alphaproteobacteria bacterium]|nr:GcrA family cell cycle regulator [Alphaproteobacteria bacterium]
MSMVWTPERIEMLQSLWREGYSASAIAERLGGISRNAVIGKAHRLLLPSRPSPIKREERVKPATPQRAQSGHGCMWPIGDPRSPEFRFCEEPADPGRPYCASHCAQAYQRREDAA